MSDPEQPFSGGGGGGLSRSAVVISSKVMVASIILLFLVVVFVMFLHLYARWFWSRRRLSEPVSRSGRHRFVFISDVDPAQVRSQGLDPVLIKSIPVFVYPAVSGGAGGECAVCLSEFEEGEKGRTLPQCKHSFHVDCIDMWFGTHSTCPLCRTVVTSAEVSEAEVIPVEDSARNEEEFRFPTNLLFYGEGNRVIEVNSTSSEQGSSRGGGRGRDIRIDIPARGEARLVEEEPLPDGISPGGLAMKSPSTRLRILKRLLSRENRTPTTGCTAEAAGDVEQGRAQKPCSRSK